MPEANQFVFTHREIVEVLIKKLNIHKGRWILLGSFGVLGGNYGPSADKVGPGVMLSLTDIGIQKEPSGQKLPEEIVVDAAKVNPAKKPKPQAGSKSTKKKN